MTIRLAEGLYVLSGAVNTGVLVRDGAALLFDCCDTVTPTRLAELGAESVETILCTQHRRPNVAEAYPFVAAGARLVVPEHERALFEDVDRYWADWRNRWHVYRHQPGPQVLARPLSVAETVDDGATLSWRGHTIQVLATPGATDGSVTYLLELGGRRIAFCGDLICGPGQLWDLHSLQKGFDGIVDYHGFMGNRHRLLPSLRRLRTAGCDVLVPSHGPTIEEPSGAMDLLLQRLDALWRNYTSISALNHYFPNLLDETRNDPQRMAPAETCEPPSWVRRVAFTSYAVVSESGALFLLDCGHDIVVDQLQRWLAHGAIRSVEGCWVTHYHDDHVDSLHRLATAFGCPILADEHMAEIVEHPQRFFLPCISPVGAPVSRATRHGDAMDWHEFRFTFLHLPGQTLYHGGLLVQGPDASVLFIGDSGAPTGLDDYTAGNRVFLGAGVGSRRCLEIWRAYRPDWLLNQHQELAFRFTDAQLDYMEAQLVERERMLGELTPWAHANLATDEWWARTYPYWQEIAPGAECCIEVHLTNHGPSLTSAAVEPVLPHGWACDSERSSLRVEVPARTDGMVGAFCRVPDGVARAWITAPSDAAPGRYVVPFRLTWDGRYLGQYRHALVDVC